MVKPLHVGHSVGRAVHYTRINVGRAVRTAQPPVISFFTIYLQKHIKYDIVFLFN